MVALAIIGIPVSNVSRIRGQYSPSSFDRYAKRLTYTYDAIGQRRYLVDADGGRFTYSFDPVGRTASLINPEGDRTTWTDDVASRVTVQKLANGTRAS